MPAMHTLATPDGIDLHLRRWQAAGTPRGTVQIVHGLGEHIGRYERVALALNAAGWNVAGHDLRGHGKSGGPRGTIAEQRSMLDDVALVTDHLRGAKVGAPQRPHVLLGHSMGGLIAATLCAEAPPLREVDGLVLSSPALDPGLGTGQKLLLALAAPLAPRLRLGNGLNPEFVSRDPAVVAAYRADPLVHDRVTPRLVRFIVDGGRYAIERAPHWKVPTLLMWAGADRLVAPRGSAAFASAAPPGLVTAREWPGLYHEIFNEPERQQVLATLTAWLARL
jgi:alpha-beta hydrolase superfamily lysophospholipase